MSQGGGEHFMWTQKGAPPDVTVRPATVADAERIAEIHVRTWQVAYRGLLPDALLDALGATLPQRVSLRRAALERASRKEGTLVAERGGQVVGFAIFGPSRDADAADGQGELYAIYVDPDAWDTGAGRALMQRAQDALRRQHFREATLWVLGSNERARRFYQLAGWHADGASRVERRGEVEMSEIRFRVRL